MEEAYKDWMTIRRVGRWAFLLVPAHPGSPGQRAVKRLLLLLLSLNQHSSLRTAHMYVCIIVHHCRTQHSTDHHHHNHFTALFLGPPGWAGARRELLDSMVQRKTNRGRSTDHPAGRHSIRTNHCPPPLSPHFLQAGCPSCCPINSVKALKATTQHRPVLIILPLIL